MLESIETASGESANSIFGLVYHGIDHTSDYQALTDLRAQWAAMLNAFKRREGRTVAVYQLIPAPILLPPSCGLHLSGKGAIHSV